MFTAENAGREWTGERRGRDGARLEYGDRRDCGCERRSPRGGVFQREGNRNETEKQKELKKIQKIQQKKK